MKMCSFLICLLLAPPVTAGDPQPAGDPAQRRARVQSLLSGLRAPLSGDRKATLELLDEYAAEAFAAGALPRLLDLARSDADPGVREMALRVLGSMGPQARDAVVPLALELIAQNQPGRVRGWAAYALGKMKPPVKLVAKPLIPLLLLPDDFLNAAVRGALLDLDDKVLVLMFFLVLQAQDDHTKIRLLDAIGQFKERARELVPQLLDLRRASKSERLRQTLLATALRILPADSAQARELVLEAFRAAKAGYARLAAISDLGKLGPAAREALPLLAEILAGEDKDARERALGAIASIVTPETAGDLVERVTPFLEGEYWTASKAADALTKMGPAGAARLLAATGSQKPRTRRFAWEALGRMPIGPHGLLEALAVRLDVEDEPQVKEAILGKMAAHGPAAVPILATALRSELHRPVRASIVYHLGQCGPAALAPLMVALSDPDLGVTGQAAAALGQLGPAAAPAVPGILAVERGRGLGDAVRAIEAIGPAAGPALVDALGSPTAVVRARAAYGLGLLGPPAAAAVVPLCGVLFDKEREVRMWAAWSLGKMGPAAAYAVEDLQAALLDEEHSVREFAARSLGELGEAGLLALPDLIRLLGDERLFVAEKAAESLGSFGARGAPAVDALVRCLEACEDGSARRASAKALGRIGLRQAPVRRALLRALGDEKARVRWAAGEALLKVGEPDDYGAARRVIRKAPDEAFEEDAAARRRFNRMLERP